MRKILRYLILALVLLALGLFVSYQLRQNSAKNQMISPSATSVLSIALDDIVIDNLSSIILERKQEGSKEDRVSKWTKELRTSPGVAIPSWIYMFSLNQDPLAFYGILEVKDYDKVFSYFANTHANQMSFLDKEIPLVSILVNSHISVVFNKEYLVYKIQSSKQENTTDLVDLLKDKDSWVKYKDLSEFYNLSPKGHISYLNKDRSVAFSADLAKSKVNFLLDWNLLSKTNQQGYIREVDPTSKALYIYNTIDMELIPGLKSLAKAMVPQGSDLSYFDLEIAKDSVLVNKSRVEIGFDQDFNEVQKTINYTELIPNITYSFYTQELREVDLPTELIYPFSITLQDGFSIASTKQQSFANLKKKIPNAPLQVYVNFEDLPLLVDNSLVRELQQNKAKLLLDSEWLTSSSVRIWGSLSWKNKDK